MIVTRNLHPTRGLGPVPAICLDCPDCKGTCREVLDMIQMPDLFLRGARPKD